MARIIKRRAVIEDSWLLLDKDAAGALPFGGDLIVPLELWTSEREALAFRLGRIGIWLDAGAEPAVIARDLARLDVIAIRFASFTDGRGYSMARLLRERFGYRGELRAIGDVLRDQLCYLSRCGFDAFSLRADQDPEQALAALDEFSETYQAAADRPEPLFRRRLRAPAQAKAA